MGPFAKVPLAHVAAHVPPPRPSPPAHAATSAAAPASSAAATAGAAGGGRGVGMHEGRDRRKGVEAAAGWMDERVVQVCGEEEAGEAERAGRRGGFEEFDDIMGGMALGAEPCGGMGGVGRVGALDDIDEDDQFARDLALCMTPRAPAPRAATPPIACNPPALSARAHSSRLLQSRRKPGMPTTAPPPQHQAARPPRQATAPCGTGARGGGRRCTRRGGSGECSGDEDDADAVQQRNAAGNGCSVERGAEWWKGSEGKRVREWSEKLVRGCPSLHLNYADIISAWSDQGHDGQSPWMDDRPPSPATCAHPSVYSDPQGEVGESGVPRVASVPHGLDRAASDLLLEEGQAEGREARVLRYREKRRNRLFSKTIRYQVRKVNADRRPRIKGRFVKRDL
ncbi:hypothetical protein CLOP_g24460 [Closterium sp. NIES-67]|nr:hypothetical protein CLOP_g24460 [Closterium sp. NIES-67]